MDFGKDYGRCFSSTVQLTSPQSCLGMFSGLLSNVGKSILDAVDHKSCPVSGARPCVVSSSASDGKVAFDLRSTAHVSNPGVVRDFFFSVLSRSEDDF